MDQSFYIGAIGAHQQLQHMNVCADNIANVNTYGFKAQRTDFTALMYQNMRGVEREELPYGVGTRMLMTSTNFAPGNAATTGRAQDYMIEGEGFFAVVELATGNVTFTRNGAFYLSARVEDTEEVDEEGQPIQEIVYYLADNEGRFVLSETGGLIEVDDPTTRYPIGIFDYNNYNGMAVLDDTRYLPVDKNGNLWMGSGKLVQGVLELSNADLAQELTKVIEAQRAYGMALKLVQTSDEIETTINSLRN